jgi:catechol 2,3-dioxygenase-like lactoylglutathione lyase family enzyme
MPLRRSEKSLKGVHHAAFRCLDAEQTRWFYEDVLGLKAAAGIVLEEVTGTGERTPYMHIFFEMGNGEFIAFFDAPSTADPAWFERKASFDMHFAFEAESEADMLAMQERIRGFGIKCAGPIDHGFVRSVYMYDPNGIQIEITARAARHDEILADEQKSLKERLADWSERTRADKVARFGEAALMRRASAPRAAGE